MTAGPTYDRWHRYLIGGVSYQRVTTLAGMLENRQGLERWKIRQVGRGLTLRQDLLAQIAACPDQDKARIDGLCEAALEAAAGTAGANLGTALHEMTARVDRREDFTPMSPWDADIKAYGTLLNEHAIEIHPEWVERTVVLPDLKVAGTFDRIVEVKGVLYVADLKTGRDLSYSWAAIAIQMALYAHGDHIWDWDTKTQVEMPQVSLQRGLVIHLPAGTATATLHVVDIAAGWEAAQLAAAVRDWRGRKDLARPARPR